MSIIVWLCPSEEFLDLYTPNPRNFAFRFTTGTTCYLVPEDKIKYFGSAEGSPKEGLVHILKLIDNDDDDKLSSKDDVVNFLLLKEDAGRRTQDEGRRTEDEGKKGRAGKYYRGYFYT